ncbi:cupin domain-containing protein [Brevibacillus fulvus]|uniref:Mannose-6-phosphate isomerase-like protein (Cupin superfamily) n=1 Tax=Brevibacillus fulvus TaxID=1125967 RepID=A0A938Y032_9BACL|nr:cupin domain-containing protein [Brevibacillus fulvus]MBM7589581.1 mannose-6-phosphate isomerase-like protein (cupin superfamily) [Brevibacillus fulvus]
MYPNPCLQYQWPNSMQSAWSNNWGYPWTAPSGSWNTQNYIPYGTITLQDYGTRPFVLNIDQATRQNNNYRTALWTGQHFQVTLMSINVGEDIGLEVHPTTDQFIRIEEGQGLVQMGASRDNLDFHAMAYDGYAIMIPAGTWHNITNTGNRPLKVYVIYAPPHHPFGTVQETKAIAQGMG